MDKLKIAVRLNLDPAEADFNETYHAAKQHKSFEKITSKEIRTSRSTKEQIKTLKLGVTLTDSESYNWGFKLSKLTSTRHKNTILKISHGDSRENVSIWTG